MRPLALKARRSSPCMPFTACEAVTSSVTGLVLPRMVRSPVTLNLPSPTFSTLVDVKVMVGWFATSKKLADLRSASRLSFPVSMVVTSIVASAFDFAGSCSSYWTVPVVLPNRPWTVVMTRCFTAKDEVECTGSMFQVVVSAEAASGKKAATASVKRRFMYSPFERRYLTRASPSVNAMDGALRLGWEAVGGSEAHAHAGREAQQIELLEPELARDEDGGLQDAHAQRDLVPADPALRAAH